MPALDQCHPQVVRALQKAGWHVHPRPYVLRISRRHHVHIDIQAQKENDKASQKALLVCEVKCFSDERADTSDLYTAFGQYVVYRSLLSARQITWPIYLAIPQQAYDGVFKRMGLEAVRDNQINLVIVDLQAEVIQDWI